MQWTDRLLLANFLLEGTIERIHHQNLFGDQEVGVMLIRGENVVMLGEIVRIVPLCRWTRCLETSSYDCGYERLLI